jgi:cytochrome P450
LPPFFHRGDRKSATSTAGSYPAGVPHADVHREAAFPLGAAATLEELEADPHPRQALLREHEPVSWVPALGAWLVTRRDLVLHVMRDAETYTVDHPGFSTAQVVGPSMLSLDGDEHARHRDPFARPLRLDAVRERFAAFVEDETARLLGAVAPAGQAEVRRALAGPLAVASMARALGLGSADAATALGWYERIVGAVDAVSSGQPVTPAGREAFADLDRTVRGSLHGAAPGDSMLAAAHADGLDDAGVVSNAAVLLFGGIETTEGMIANLVWHVLGDGDALAAVRAEPALLANAVEESLRLEPAATRVDRFATRDVELAGAPIRAGDLVVVSLGAANRDPAFFPDPDRFDVRRENARHHAAFAHGPHVCLGMHLARIEAQVALRQLLELPDVRLDPGRPTAPRGLVFRKPPAVHVRWTAG